MPLDRSSGLGLEAQEAKCRQACEQRDWEVVELFTHAGVSGKIPPAERPALVDALAVMCAGKRVRRADVLVMATLDRASRSAFDLLSLRREAEQCGFELVVLDPELDTIAPAGNFQFTVMAHDHRRSLPMSTRSSRRARAPGLLVLGTATRQASTACPSDSAARGRRGRPRGPAQRAG